MAIEDQRVIELFAGPGGFSEGLASLGVQPYQALGVEWDVDACRTAELAGHRRLFGDVTAMSPCDVAIRAFGHTMITGLHASPPCQGMSRAGKGKGRDDTEVLVAAVEAIGQGEDIDTCIAQLRKVAADSRSPLSLEPLRWIKDLQPDWVSLEQVPAALPIWQAYIPVLRSWGYFGWAANARSEQWGVPQTRIRAILLASRLGEVSAPVPTHSKFHTGTPSRLDPDKLRWVTMAEALGLSVSDLVGFPRKGDKQEKVEIDGKEYRARDLRPTVKPSFAVTEKARSWVRFTGEVAKPVEPQSPQMVLVSKTVIGSVTTCTYEVVRPPEPEVWPGWRPASTVTTRDVVTAPGSNANRFNGAAKSRNDGVRISVAEAGVLQSFRADYPWQGTKESQFRQTGNSYPVRMAAAMVSHVMAAG